MLVLQNCVTSMLQLKPFERPSLGEILNLAVLKEAVKRYDVDWKQVKISDMSNKGLL